MGCGLQRGLLDGLNKMPRREKKGPAIGCATNGTRDDKLWLKLATTGTGVVAAVVVGAVVVVVAVILIRGAATFVPSMISLSLKDKILCSVN